MNTRAAAVPFPGARLLADEATVTAAWDRLAAAIQPHADAGRLLLLGVLLGGAIPLVHISQRLKGDVLLDACRVSRYRSGRQGGVTEWVTPPRTDLAGRDVVVVDDILDEGWTLAAVAAHCREHGARSVRVAVLVHKRHGRPSAGLEPDFAGLDAGDEFLVGCGMDHDGHWRHLPAVYALPRG